MIRIKRFLRKLDAFGAPFSFKYNNENTFTTALGGLFFILFLIVMSVVGIYYFIPFFNRKNFSIIYYTMNMANADKIKLSESKAAFAFGLNCYDDDDGTKAEDLLKLDNNFYSQKKNREGKTEKTWKKISTNSCNYEDLNNNYIKSLN